MSLASAFVNRNWLTDDDIERCVKYVPARAHNKVAYNGALRVAIATKQPLGGDADNLKRLILVSNTNQNEGTHWLTYCADTRISTVVLYDSGNAISRQLDQDIVAVVQRTLPDYDWSFCHGQCAKQTDNWSCGHRCIINVRALLADDDPPLYVPTSEIVRISGEITTSMFSK